MAIASFANPRPIPGAVATLGVDARRTFIQKTYTHLAGAIALFVGLEYLFLQSEIGLRWTEWALFGGRWNWLLVLGLFMVVGWIAERWAQSDTSRTTQYIGLGLYIVAETIIFAPLLFLVAIYANAPDLIVKAGIITLTLFGGLTLTVLLTKKDFSFLRGFLIAASFGALGVIFASILFGFALGSLFSGVMVLIAGGFILYYTSQILAHYPPTHHVAAALALFASIALMFYYVLYFLLSLNSD